MSTTLRQLANARNTESIDVLLVDYGRRDGVLGDVFREGQLDEDAVDCGVVIEVVDALEDSSFCDIVGEFDEFAFDVGLGYSISTAMSEKCGGGWNAPPRRP